MNQRVNFTVDGKATAIDADSAMRRMRRVPITLERVKAALASS
jgi:hypothetical protein